MPLTIVFQPARNESDSEFTVNESFTRFSRLCIYPSISFIHFIHSFHSLYPLIVVPYQHQSHLAAWLTEFPKTPKPQNPKTPNCNLKLKIANLFGQEWDNNRINLIKCILHMHTRNVDKLSSSFFFELSYTYQIIFINSSLISMQ